MSNYPNWWDKTVTIYNKAVDSSTQRVSWYKTVVDGCFWKAVNDTYTIGRGGISSTGVILETKDVICRIPKDSRFVDKRVWKELEDKTGYFTLGNGDIIILGEVEDVIDEYTRGLHSTDLVAKYKEFDSCIEVDAYVNNTGRGLGIEHYRIVGK